MIKEDVCVYFGSCADDTYPDNSREYFYRLEQLINNSYPKTLKIVCPLENSTKKEIVKEVNSYGFEPYFCDLGTDAPCGECHSCKLMLESGGIQ